MAEGHAVIRWAQALQVLIGENLLEVQLPRRWNDRAAATIGQSVEKINTHGKLLLLHLSGGWTILCHAMQYGSWQVGEAGMTLRKEAKYVRLRLLTAHHEAVFYHGPIIELLTPTELALNQRLNLLGPDLMAPDFDRAEAWRRLQLPEYRDTPLGELVLNQHIMAGVGNIFKSEGLFLANLHPCRTIPSITRSELDLFWDKVIPLMWKSAERFGRTITLPLEVQAQHPGALHWVYARKDKPCLVCHTPIHKIYQGQLPRSTCFCPQCQPAS